MARIAGVNLAPKKQIFVALTSIYGVGIPSARRICSSVGLSPILKVVDLTDQQVDSLRQKMADILLEGDLRREVTMNIKRLIDIGSYRGVRHKKGLPARGQRTRTNARTRKGAKGASVSIKK